MTVARQAPLSMGSHRQEYWNEFPIPPPRANLPYLHIFLLLMIRLLVFIFFFLIFGVVVLFLTCYIKCLLSSLSHRLPLWWFLMYLSIHDSPAHIHTHTHTHTHCIPILFSRSIFCFIILLQLIQPLCISLHSQSTSALGFSSCYPCLNSVPPEGVTPSYIYVSIHYDINRGNSSNHSVLNSTASSPSSLSTYPALFFF